MKHHIWLWVFLVGVIIAAGGCSMKAFDPIVLFSEVNGRVLSNGSPIEGADVVQKADWSDNDKNNITKHVLTDKDGAFHFDAIVRNAGLRRISLSQPTTLESIVISYDGRDYVAWEAAKMDYEPDSELGGRKIFIICDLSRKPEVKDGYYGICIAE